MSPERPSPLIAGLLIVAVLWAVAFGRPSPTAASQPALPFSVESILPLEQGPNMGPGQSPKFERLSVEHGLSQSTVTCILQDSRGFMWFGTRDGLNRYDGSGFKAYKHDPQNFSSLGHNQVTALAED